MADTQQTRSGNQFILMLRSSAGIKPDSFHPAHSKVCIIQLDDKTTMVIDGDARYIWLPT